MGIEEEVTKSVIERIVENHFEHTNSFLKDLFESQPEPTDRVCFKRIKPAIMERVMNLLTFYRIVLGGEPRHVIMGIKEKQEIIKTEWGTYDYFRTYPLGELPNCLCGLDITWRNIEHHLEIV